MELAALLFLMCPAAFNHDSDSGQTMAEYSVVVGVLILGVVAAISFFGAAVAQYILNFAGAIG